MTKRYPYGPHAHGLLEILFSYGCIEKKKNMFMCCSCPYAPPWVYDPNIAGPIPLDGIFIVHRSLFIVHYSLFIGAIMVANVSDCIVRP